MISHFPVLYPGELLYSACARFSDRMKYPTIGATTTELFGFRHAVPTIDLPNMIDRLVADLPTGHVYTSDTLIDQHTLLPLYAPFLTIQNYDRLRAAMRGGGMRVTKAIAGINAGRVRSPLYLRNCPCCDAENIKRFGETYWHRLHHIPGVDVCPFHNIFLQDTNVRRLYPKNRHAFHTAQQADRSLKVQVIDPTNHGHVLLATMAKTAAGIIDKLRQPEGPLALRRRYEDRLQANGYLSLGGSIRLRELRSDIVRFFSAPLLAQLQSDLLGEKAKEWLAYMFSSRERINAPLRHLLLMTFFGDTANSFFDRTSTPTQPAEDRSYPCLNAICPAHGQAPIKSLEHTIAKGNRRMLTLFRCPICGHASTRTADGKALNWVYDRGHLWKAQFKVLWEDVRLNITQIKHILHSDHMTIKRLAIKAGLPFPRLCRDRRSAIKLPPPNTKTRAKYAIGARRAEYLALRQAQPAATGRQLRESHSGLVTWLYYHDREWMLNNTPRNFRRSHPKLSVDWHARDEVFRAQVIMVAMQIKNAPGKPRRASRAAIESEVRARLRLQFDQVRMPLTRLALQGSAETAEQFGVRRIRYMAQTFVAKHKIPGRYEFLEAAGINTQRMASGNITDAIEIAFAQIRMAVKTLPC